MKGFNWQATRYGRKGRSEVMQEEFMLRAIAKRQRREKRNLRLVASGGFK